MMQDSRATPPLTINGVHLNEKGDASVSRLLDEALLPLDPDVFKRQVEYHRTLTEHLQKQGRATP